MLGAPRSTIQLKCNEQAFPEFPNLLFGTQIDSGISYFDATFYIQKKGLQKSVKDFINEYRVQIGALCDAYDIKKEDVSKINEEGHHLIDGNLVYLFISFVEPYFLSYMCDRMHELMTSGVSVSDTYLLSSVKNRIPLDIIKTIYENGNT